MKYLDTAKEVLANKWHLGIRATRKDEEYEVEDECRESYDWDLENDCSTYFTTKETAGGTCGVRIDTDVESAEELAERIAEVVKKFATMGYGDGGQTILFAGWDIERDRYVDDDEIRIKGAWVQEIVEVGK
jgi:hypothetical protein